MPNPPPFLIVRHGEAVSNVDPDLGAWANTGLSDRGVMQVEGVADRLESELNGESFDLVSSDMNRALESAEIIGKHLGVEPIINKGVSQYRFGLSPETSIDEARTLRSEPCPRIADWRPYSTGETIGEMYRRVGLTMADLLLNQKHVIVIVSHSYTIDKIFNWWIGFPEDALKSIVFDTANASLSKLGYTPLNDRGLLYVNDTRHLPRL